MYSMWEEMCIRDRENQTIPMRNEQEMYQLFLDIANNNDRILAVYMNGSRTNKNVPKDIFQDYDIVYVVEKTADFINDRLWICLLYTSRCV